jgi:hypothetical protein
MPGVASMISTGGGGGGSGAGADGGAGAAATMAGAANVGATGAGAGSGGSGGESGSGGAAAKLVGVFLAQGHEGRITRSCDDGLTFRALPQAVGVRLRAG